MDRAAGGRRVRLGDLGVVVIGLAVVCDVARRSRAAWGGGRPEVRHALGLLVLTLGVGVALGLVDRLVRRPAGIDRRWAIGWRVGALGWLVAMLAGLAGALVAVEPELPGPPVGSVAVWLRVTTLQVALGLVGLVLAASPVGARPARSRPRGSATLGVLGAVAVGLTVLVLSQWAFPYLVLLAMEFVQHALTRAPLVRRPIVFARLTTAALGALPGLVACLVAAIGVDAELRRAGGDPLGDGSGPRTWIGVARRGLIVLVAAGGAAWVALVGIPALSRPLAEGIALVVPPGLLGMLALGYVALAAGLAARGAGRLAAAVAGPEPPAAPEPPPARPVGPWPRRLGGALVGLAAVAVGLAAIQRINRDYEAHWYIPIPLSRLVDLAHAPMRRFNSWPGSWGWSDLIERPDGYLVGLAAPWLVVGLGRLAWAREAGRPAALDLVGADRRALGRFLGWWGTLAVAITASLPGLVVVALALIDRMVRWADL